MAAWGYGFYLLMLKVSLTSERYFHHSKIKFVSPRGYVISSIYVAQIYFGVSSNDKTLSYLKHHLHKVHYSIYSTDSTD